MHMGILADSNRINKFLMITLSLIIAISCIIFTGTSALAQFKSGSPVPGFELESVEGEIYQLSQFYNKQDHLLLYFADIENTFSIDKLKDIITFFEDYQPKESYKIIAIVKTDKDNKAKENLLTLQNNTQIPLFILLDTDLQNVLQSYKIKDFPTILLLRHDLKIRKTYSGFNTRIEKSFYQYLTFTFTSQKGSGTGSGCEGGVCPPPE